MVKICPELSFLQVNTDGITIMCPISKLKDIYSVCDQLREETGLDYEANEYKNMILRDVNNYIAEYSDSVPDKEHIKLKGCFEIDKECYKDPSMRIIPIALKQYFVYGIPVEETIRNHKNIFDFCIRLKINRTSKAVFRELCNNELQETELGRTTRYFCSTTGGSITV